MTPDRLQGWLKHKPAGSKRVQIVCDSIGGIVVLADWDREAIDAGEVSSAELTEQMIDTAQEYTDAEGEPCKFLVRWIGSNDRVLKVVTHRAKPTPPPEDGEDEGKPGRQAVDQLTTMIRELHKANLDLAKQNVAAVNTVQAAYEKTIAMLGAHNEALHKLLSERAAEPAAMLAELTPEQREESLQRARALEAFTGKLPEVIDLGLLAIARKLGGAVAEAAGEGDTH